MQNVTANQIAVISTPAAAGVPESYSLGFGKSFPASAFSPAAGGVPVVLSGLAAYTSNAGDRGLSVVATSADGFSQTFIALAKGFVGGEGSPAAGAFLLAVQDAVASGSPVFLAVAGSSTRHFCALSSEPFGAVSAPAAPASDQILF
jgi:hypothetical protein